MRSHRRVPSAIRTCIAIMGACASLPWSVAAQDGRTFTACYVPEIGVVYLIDEPGLPTDCLSEAHQPFSWTEGPGGAPELTEGSVTSDVLADAAVTADKIAAGAVQATHMGTGAVGSDQVLDDALTHEDLAPGSVTAAELAQSAVGSDHIEAGAVTNQHIADGTVLSADLAAGSVTDAHIADGTLTGADIEDGSVGSTDLDSDVITAVALAYVNGTTGTPTLVRQTNAISVNRRAGSPTGVYEITFAAPVNLATAYWSATTLGSGLTVGLILQSSSVLVVSVRNSENAYTDASFFVIGF